MIGLNDEAGVPPTGLNGLAVFLKN